METEKLFQRSVSYLKTLCEDIKDRSVGSAGNRQATDFFNKEISSFGWNSETSELNVVDWEDGGATLQAEDICFKVSVSPYSLGCNVREELTSISNIGEFERADIRGKIVLLYGEIAKEQFMPKNFVFYNPEDIRELLPFLRKKSPLPLFLRQEETPLWQEGYIPFR